MGTATPGPPPAADRPPDGDGPREINAALTPPDPSGLEAWIRQVLRLAGPRATTFMPPLPPVARHEPPPEENAAD